MGGFVWHNDAMVFSRISLAAASQIFEMDINGIWNAGMQKEILAINLGRTGSSGPKPYPVDFAKIILISVANQKGIRWVIW